MKCRSIKTVRTETVGPRALILGTSCWRQWCVTVCRRFDPRRVHERMGGPQSRPGWLLVFHFVHQKSQMACFYTFYLTGLCSELHRIVKQTQISQYQLYRRIKKDWSYTSTPPLGLRGLFYGELYLYLYLYFTFTFYQWCRDEIIIK